jgi:hypothetical protein
MAAELSPEDPEAFFRELERQMRTGQREWGVRIHVHRTEDRVHCAFALTKGAGRYSEVETSSCEEPSELTSLFRRYAEKIWSSLFPERG